MSDLLSELPARVREWPEERKREVLVALQKERWLELARPEQVPPEGDWRVWFCQGGRGGGKTRTGAETLAGWEGDHEPGEYAIVAPTFADARDTCAESSSSGIIQVLGGFPGPRIAEYNRTYGQIHLKSGSTIFLDGADDGALRIQGKNLRAAWCDEAGLWKMWDRTWNESLAFAVRHDPARIVVTGTPKMGHGLIKLLVEDPKVPVSRFRTVDNVHNLDQIAVKELYERYAGTRLGKQELDGEWIAALEGDLLKRAWWRYYSPRERTESSEAFVKRMPRFQWVIVSVDTPLKDKESSDNVAIQAWGVDKANRYLLDARVDKMGYDAARRAILEMSRWARKLWPCQHRLLIENQGYGIEMFVDLKRELGGVEKIIVGPEGSKGMRALAASDDLETGNVFLPGRINDDLTGPDPSSPALTHSLVDEAALFQLDGSHESHDDQVDAWSQCMNWLRKRQTRSARAWSSFKVRRPDATPRRSVHS